MNRIAYFAHTAEVSGPNNSLRRLVGGLDRRQFEPVIYFPADGPVVQELHALGERCRVVPARALRHSVTHYPRFAIDLFKSSARIARQLKEDEVALVHANTSVTPQAALAAWRAGIPFVCHVRESLRRSRLNDVYFRQVLRFADRIVTVSRAVRDEVLSRTSVDAERLEVIYNGLDVSDFDRQSRVSDAAPVPVVPKGATVVALPAFFLPHKGHEVLLAAVASLVLRAGLNVQLWLIGHEAPEERGHFTRRLVAFCEALAIADHVHFLGLRRDVPALLSSADIVCVPSTYPDPLPNAVLEGMAAGKVVVASAVGGIPEQLDDGKAGVLVPPGDAEALARALRRLIDDRDTRTILGRAARRRVEEQFTSQKYVERVQQAYRSVLAIHTSRAHEAGPTPHSTSQGPDPGWTEVES